MVYLYLRRVFQVSFLTDVPWIWMSLIFSLIVGMDEICKSMTLQ